MMKFKPNQTRTYDGEGFKRRAACLCFKSEKEDEVSPPADPADLSFLTLPQLPLFKILLLKRGCSVYLVQRERRARFELQGGLKHRRSSLSR